MRLIHIIFLGLFFLTTFLDLYSQKDLYSENLAPIQLDSFEEKVLIVGSNRDNNEIIEVFLKRKNDTIFRNITYPVNLELDMDSKVHFDNYGHIWAFGKNKLWKFENEEWMSITTPLDLLPNRYFLDFCFDEENNIYVVTRIEFVKSREYIGGTLVKVLDSVNHEILKINSNTLNYEILQHYNHKTKYTHKSPIHTFAKIPNGGIAFIQPFEQENAIIYKNNNLSYTSIPIIPKSVESIQISSMAYDKQMNLWISIRLDNDLTEYSQSNGVHKILNSGQVVSWDSSTGLNSTLFGGYEFQKIRVNKIVVDDLTGLVWCATNYGFFSIDESKSKKEQIIFYTKDSILNRFKSTVLNFFQFFNFIINDIVIVKNNIYISHPVALFEFKNSQSKTNVNESDNKLELLKIDIVPYPTTTSKIITQISNAKIFDNLTLEIIDITGKSYLSYNIENTSEKTQIPIDIIGLSTGVYYVVLRSGQRVVVKQFVLNN